MASNSRASVGDDLPQVVLVHYEVIQLLLCCITPSNSLWDRLRPSSAPSTDKHLPQVVLLVLQLPQAGGEGELLTSLLLEQLLGSCSLISSKAWLCFCLMSAICCSWTLASSSRFFFSEVTSTSRLDLERQNEELLLCCGGVQSVLQFRLEGLQLLSQVPAVFLSLGSRLPLQLQILLQLGDLSLQLPDLLLGHVLGCSLLLDPEDMVSYKKKSVDIVADHATVKNIIVNTRSCDREATV
ncbi:hypothetical protein EYF80_006219 [Liparis tanakae]|uniref:Uncharacterized protein n=1 Tax=Liparis tanakae TaxID=230148 RepID=A0A4Z2J175_9TELE|nr:hypothetical protein EYF80_006219 [Liparis tanakae]